MGVTGLTGALLLMQGNLGGASAQDGKPPVSDTPADKVDWPDPAEKVEHTEDQWRAMLDANAFYILRQDGTERPFKNAYHAYKGDGVYACRGCGNKLFDSATKFDSGTGWPSFYKPVSSMHVTLIEEGDVWQRTEVVCARCDGHLGHVFDDAPGTPTGLRYCMNSGAMVFHMRTAEAGE